MAKAGWYQDTENFENHRFWNGTRWTDLVRVKPSPTGATEPRPSQAPDTSNSPPSLDDDVAREDLSARDRLIVNTAEATTGTLIRSLDVDVQKLTWLADSVFELAESESSYHSHDQRLMMLGIGAAARDQAEKSVRYREAFIEHRRELGYDL